jgi:hypothetical protein
VETVHAGDKNRIGMQDTFEIITNGFYVDKNPANPLGLPVSLMSELPLSVRTAWQALALLNEEQIDELVHAMHDNCDPAYAMLVTRMGTLALEGKEPGDAKPF